MLVVLRKNQGQMISQVEGAFLSRGTSLSVFMEQTPSVSHATLYGQSDQRHVLVDDWMFFILGCRRRQTSFSIQRPGDNLFVFRP